MNINETKAILKEIALIDNRKLDESVAMAWHAVIGHMKYEVAQQALILARQDSNIGYLEPKHIVQWGREASHRLNRNSYEEPTNDMIPEPLCRSHSKKITECKACCRALAQQADAWGMFVVPSKDNDWHDPMFANTKKLHAWAKENIYA